MNLNPTNNALQHRFPFSYTLFVKYTSIVIPCRDWIEHHIRVSHLEAYLPECFAIHPTILAFIFGYFYYGTQNT